MGIAVLGCGVIGEFHATSITELSPRARLVLVVDRDAARAAELAAKHGARASTSMADALTSADVDTVAVCTPSGCHAEQAVAALEAGKNVVIEKPIDVTLAAAHRVADAERRTARTVTVISQHRFDAASTIVREAVLAGRLGRITSGVATIPWWRTQEYYDSGDWRGTRALDGGGALMNQGIHTVDLLVWMLGEPVEVFAWTDRLAHSDIDVEDTAVATVRFASGALGVVHGTTAAYPGMGARLQLHGDRGTAIIDDDRLVAFHTVEGDQLAGAGALAGRSDAGAGSDPRALSDAHTDQYRDFLDAVETGRSPLVTVEEATRTLAVILAIYESAASGRSARL